MRSIRRCPPSGGGRPGRCWRRCRWLPPSSCVYEERVPWQAGSANPDSRRRRPQHRRDDRRPPRAHSGATSLDPDADRDRAAGDPVSNYDTALGGNASKLVDWYLVSAELPGFVGGPSYKGEQLLMWFYWDVPDLLEPVGIFHEGFDSLGFGMPILTPGDAGQLVLRRPAELLLLGVTGHGFEAALRALGPYRPVLVRSTVLRHGSAVLHAPLIVLRSFARRSIWPALR